MDGKKKTYSSLLAGESSNDDWYTLSSVWQVLFYWGQPNKTFTLLSLVFLSTSPLFGCEMAMQMLLNHRGVFVHASVYKSKSEGRSASFICWCYLLLFTSTHLYLPTHQENTSAAAGEDDAWSESCWELSQQQARGKIEMVIAAVRVGQHCHALQSSAQQSSSTSRVCWQQDTLPMAENEE